MNRINLTLQSLREKRRKALVTYIVSGDPSPGATVAAMHALVDAGADIIELGVPFSDPMAEGPVIQRGHERALAQGASLRKTLAYVSEFRARDANTPVVLMGYANPVERMGYKHFAQLAKEAGVDGLLTVDLPLEEGGELDTCLQEAGLENIFLVAPTTSSARIKDICEAARGFVYCVSFKGVTGADRLDVEAIAENLAGVKSVAKTPVLVGFGIKDAASAKQIGKLSDGVVVGSALVNAMAQNSGNLDAIIHALASIIQPMRHALDELVEISL